MEIITLFYIVCGFCFVVAILALLFKYSYYRRVRKHSQSYLRLSLLGLYSEEQILTTSSSGKRNYMLAANKVTIAFYICIAPCLVLLAMLIVQLITALMQMVESTT